MASVSRVYVPNHYRVFLSPQDREQFASYEPALRKELSDYLLEHARQESFALSTRPQVEFHTDERLDLGRVRHPGPAAGAARGGAARRRAPGAPAPSAGDFGHTMVYSPSRDARRVEPAQDRRQALLVGGGRRNVLSGSRVVIGRSREADIVLQDPNVSRRHAELRREDGGWQIVDLGSTNGIKVNGRRVDNQPLSAGRPDHHRRDGPHLRARLRRWTSRSRSRSSSASLSSSTSSCCGWCGAPCATSPRYGGSAAAAEPVEIPSPGRRQRGTPEPRAGVCAAAGGGCRDGARAGYDLRRGRRGDLRPLRRSGHTRGRPVRVVGARAHLRPRRLHVPRGHGLDQRHLPERAPAEGGRAPARWRTRSGSATANTATRSSRVALRIVEQAGRTDVGRQRTANEDSLVVQPPLFAVADGMGGAKAGEVASAVAVQAVESARESGRAGRGAARGDRARRPTGASTTWRWRTSRGAAWARRSRSPRSTATR